MAADRVGTDTGDTLSARCPTPLPCSYLALAVSTWLAGDACLVIVHIAPTDWVCSVVSHAASAVHSVPPASVPYCLAYAGSLQWPTLLGTSPANAYTR